MFSLVHTASSPFAELLPPHLTSTFFLLIKPFPLHLLNVFVAPSGLLIRFPSTSFCLNADVSVVPSCLNLWLDGS